MFNGINTEDVLIAKFDGLTVHKGTLEYIRDTLHNAINWLDYADSVYFDTSILRGRYKTTIEAFEKQLRAVRYLMRKNDLEYDIGVCGADNIRPSRTAGFFD